MTISKSAAVRLTLCEFEHPATVNADKVAKRAAERFKITVAVQDVHWQRNYLRKMKVVLAPEDIRRFCEKMGDRITVADTAPRPKVKVKNTRRSIRHPDVPPRSFFVREALLEMKDFQSASTQRICVLARAKAAHAGFPNMPINGDDVRSTIKWLEKLFGTPLTHEKVRKYHEKAKSTLEARKLVADRVAAANGTPHNAPVPLHETPVPTRSMIESLKQANRIARSFGGVDEAIAMLHQLKEVLA